MLEGPAAPFGRLGELFSVFRLSRRTRTLDISAAPTCQHLRLEMRRRDSSRVQHGPAGGTGDRKLSSGEAVGFVGLRAFLDPSELARWLAEVGRSNTEFCVLLYQLLCKSKPVMDKQAWKLWVNHL